MIIIKTRQPDPELEQKIRMLLEREHIEAEQISIGSQEKLVLPRASCNIQSVKITAFVKNLCLRGV